MTEMTLYVPSISCMHCVHTIKTGLSALAGMQSVDARVDTKEVKVTFDAPLTLEQIKATLTEINYPAVEAN